MKTDIYTKIILTVIAVCLTFIVLKQVDIIPPIYADTPSNVIKDGNYGLVPLNKDGSINVKLNSDIVDVNIVEADGLEKNGNRLRVDIVNQ
jgi:hypothetical protein